MDLCKPVDLCSNTGSPTCWRSKTWGIGLDQSVLRSMVKWPNVPAVFGWLSLSRRGKWLIKGEPITHPNSIGFINRNYMPDSEGRWYFQNAAQQVFVTLEYTPWVYIIDSENNMLTHTGTMVEMFDGAWLDEDGNLLILTEHGLGILDDRDLGAISNFFTDNDSQSLSDDELENRMNSLMAGEKVSLHLNWLGISAPVKPIKKSDVPSCFGYELEPQA